MKLPQLMRKPFCLFCILGTLFIVTSGAANASGPDITLEGKIKPNAITVHHLAKSSVQSSRIASAAVIEKKISNGAVTSAKIAKGAVTSVKIGKQQVTSQSIRHDAVNGTHIENGSIKAEDLDSKLLKRIANLEMQIKQLLRKTKSKR